MRALPVFYSPRMVADSEGFSPSAAKPAAVLESWRALGIPLAVAAPAPVTLAQLAAAHDPRFVAGVLGGTLANGFGSRSPEVAASLPWTSGAMLAAAREAIRNGKAAIAPCSGFHHARYASAAGFCTFNGLAVAALALKAEGAAARVGILDFDHHYGDGTDEIIGRLGLAWIEHYSAGREWYEPRHAARFLAKIPEYVGRMADCDVILFQAGADPHVDDPLGGWLTTAQLAARDRTVFETAKALGVPVAWNLAGGYQEPLRKVLDIHDNTLRECWAVHGEAAPAQAAEKGVRK
jgi:acetoin utilization deacetylase AcuC-like enzyme